MEELKKLIKNRQSKSFSDTDIMNVIDGKANLVTYDQLNKYKNLDQLLGPYKACVILYLTSSSYGHWVCIFKKGPKLIEFFDSYAIKPDSELLFVPQHFRKVSNQDYPHLSYLIYSSGYNIDYNSHKLQSKKEDITTCGRWVAIRLFLRDLSLQKFVKLFKDHNFLNPDQLVTLISIFI